MVKTIKMFIGVMVAVFGLTTMFYSTIYVWWFSPTLTAMQLLHQNWPILLMGTGIFLIGILALEINSGS